MPIELKPRDRRALLALGFAVMVYLLIATIAIPTYGRIQEGSQSVARKEADLAKYRRALAGQEHYKQSLEQVSAAIAGIEARLIVGDNPSLSSVALQTIVEEAAKKTSIALTQRTMSPARKKDARFNEITMAVSFEGTPTQLTSFLSEVRAAAKFVTVRTLQVAALDPAQEAPAKGELKKRIKVDATLAALLATPPVAGKD